MATTTVRLLASTYTLSNTSYLSMANASNMYTDTDSTTYARVSHTRAATTAYYVYVKGFNFSSIPANATVTSAIVKVKAKVTGYSAQTPALYNNTTSLSKNLSGTISTSAVTRTVDITSSWSTYKGYGNNFGIRLAIGRSNKNTASYLDIYGAEITVTYSVPETYTITTSATDCTISPTGTTSVTEGDSLTIQITADRAPTVTDNGADVSASVTKTGATAYQYILSNITTNHTIVAVGTIEAPQEQMMMFLGGNWVAISTIYKKIGGVWVEQTDLQNLFDTQTNYVKGGEL